MREPTMNTLAIDSSDKISDGLGVDVPVAISLKEALSLAPEGFPLPSCPDECRKSRASMLRKPAMLTAASQFLKSTAYHRTTGAWKRRHSQQPPLPAPPRPKRPPLEQCPPNQPFFSLTRAQVYPEMPRLIPQLSVNQTNEDVSQSSILPSSVQLPRLMHKLDQVTGTEQLDLHHGLAYRRLTGILEDVDEETDSPVSPIDSAVTINTMYHDRPSRPMIQADDRVVTPYRNLKSRDFDTSFSSLPSTTSKLALKPSPLRLSKDEQGNMQPVIPIRSTLGNQAGHRTSHMSERTPKRSAATAGCRCSFDTVSIYSIDSNGVRARLPDTPPSSPPEILRSYEGRSSPVLVNPDTCAEDLRSELGIIDDIYDMYADPEKHDKHEADADIISSRMTAHRNLTRMNTERLTRTQARLRKERARQSAAGKLEESRPFLEVPQAEFEDWLDGALRFEEHKGHVRLMSLYPNCGSQTTDKKLASDLFAQEAPNSAMSDVHEDKISMTPYDNAESIASMATVMDAKRYDTKHPATPELTPVQTPLRANSDAEYRPSLALLQDQLNALIEDCVEPNQYGDEVQSCNDTNECSPPSTCTSESDCSPTDLQKIDIEWRGRRYPVLIGDQGQIWEGPCVDAYCAEHGGTRKERAFGKI